MKLGLILAAVSALFILAAMGLYRTIGGLVEQAGSRETRNVTIDLTVVLKDRSGAPLADTAARIVLMPAPELQAPTAGQPFTTDAAGRYTGSVKATLDKAPRKRPASFFSRLMASPEPTDHVSVGIELPYMNFSWFYVEELYRFEDGDVLHDGLSLHTRDEHGRYAHRAEQDGDGGWRIADLGDRRLTTIGYDFTLHAFERQSEEQWRLSVEYTRQPEPVAR
jgi:hypothetical protein